MATNSQISDNESVRGRKKKSYEEVMQRRMITHTVCNVFFYGVDHTFVRSQDVAKEIQATIDIESSKYFESSPYEWFDVKYKIENDYEDTYVAIIASRHETDQEYNKRTTAWLKRQDKKLKQLNKYESDINSKR